jgi:hypothetical protein
VLLAQAREVFTELIEFAGGLRARLCALQDARAEPRCQIVQECVALGPQRAS